MLMVDVGHKKKTLRVAVAFGQVRMSSLALAAIKNAKVEKGDVLATARLAAIMGAKKTSELVPLCHPIGLSAVSVELRLKRRSVDIEVTVKTVERTGVEMEALTAVAAAALTIYDMLKSLDRGMIIESIGLSQKSGGASGSWQRLPKKA
jgi:cyclic pyranopterin monophosphate synthase